MDRLISIFIPSFIAVLLLAACGKDGEQSAEGGDSASPTPKRQAEQVAEEPAVVGTVSGDLSSCTFKVRMTEAREDMYGADRVGGTIQYIAQPRPFYVAAPWSLCSAS